jgi:hypothetical protein
MIFSVKPLQITVYKQEGILISLSSNIMVPPQHIVNAMSAGQEATALATTNSIRCRRRRRPHVAALPVALATLALPQMTQASIASQSVNEDSNCPPTHSGWAPSQDCKSYHWCSAGNISSLSYDCQTGLLFDSKQLTCLPAESVDCGAFWQHFGEEMEDPPPPPTPVVAETKPSVPTPMPSPRPSMLGEPIYYVDFPSQTCKSDVNSKPGWVSSEHMFSSKNECCEKMVDWIPLEQCLGDNWVETNVVFEPTTNPTIRPTSTPSDVLTEVPSYAPSLAPSAKSMHSPTPSPIDVLTLPPTSHLLAADVIQTKTQAGVTGATSSSQMEGGGGSYMMELLEWANRGIDPFSTATSWQIVNQRSQVTPTSSSSSTTDTSITELLLPVVADATISSVRTEVNFGKQSALAVDGGGSGDEKYDSLLKFDISLLDTSRQVESAKLKLHAVTSCSAGGLFSSTLSDQDWESETVTWNSAPKTDGHTIATLGHVTQSQTINVDLSSATAWYEATSSSSSFKYVTIRIESNEHSRCLYSSLEGAESEAPTLAIKYKQETATTSKGLSEDSLMTIAHGDFLELSATDDATVVAIQSERNFGQEPNLLAAYDSSTRGIFDILMRFDLAQIKDTIPRSSVLSLFAETDCESAGTFATTSVNLPWTEDSVTWSNAPVFDPRAVGGTMIGTFRELKGGNWYGFDVHQALANALLAGSDAVTFRVSSGDLHPCQYSSRNGSRAPKLMVAF